MKTQLHSPTATTHMPCPLRLLLPRHARLWASLVVLTALTFGPRPVLAAVTEAWVHRYSNVLSNSFDRPLRVVPDGAGDVIVTGMSDDNASGIGILTIKYSGADGSALWQRRQRYGATRDSGSRWGWVAVAVDAARNIVVSGPIEHADNHSESEYYTAKYAGATGAILWEKRYYGNGDYALAVAVNRAGDVVVTGRSAALKYAAADGALLWDSRVKVNTQNQTAAVDGEGNIAVAGDFFNGTNVDYYTAKYASADGALLWEKRYNGPANRHDYASAVAVDSNGNVVVTGSSYNATIKDYYTVKYASADGAVLWEKRYDGAEIDYSNAGPALALDISGNVVVTGHSYSNQDSYDYYTAKYAAADGTLLWEKRYDGPANDSFDFAQALALDGSGNVVVTGVSTDSSEVLSQGWFRFSQYYTAKYAAADGTLLWERRYNANAAFIPYWGSTPEAAVAVDDSGNIILIGSSFTGDEPSRATPDYYTAKYAAGNGTLLWENSYNGAAHHESYPVAVTMDSSGNVVRTATSGYGSSTAKYAASNGALLWEKLTPDTVTHVALDGSGSVVVIGSSYSGWESDDYDYTAKYAAEGGLLWKRRAPGTVNAVGPDGNGNVVVAGLISSLENYTAKYAGSNGALLWEKRYPGPGSSDRASALRGSVRMRPAS